METAANPVSLLSGAMLQILLVSVPLALVFSLLILAFYRLSVKRLMLASAGAAVLPAAASPAPEQAPPRPLEFFTLAADAVPVRAMAGPWRNFLVYALAGLGFALTMSLVYLRAIGSDVLPWQIAFLTIGFAWPLVIVWGFILAVTWRDWLAAIACYVVAYFAMMAAFFALVPEPQRTGLTPIMLLVLWAVNNLGMLLAVPILLRPIRAIGPLVFIATTAASAGATALLSGIGTNDELLRAIVAVAVALGLGGHQLFYLLMGLGALAGGLLGWLLLKGMGRLYRGGYISDQTLIVDSVWLLQSTMMAISHISAGLTWFFAAFLPFLVFKLICFAAFRLLAGSRAPPLHLLLLRVFALGKRSDALFRAIAKPWRHRGAIRMIAGPDLVTTTVEPHEFLDFISRNLARRFVADRQALAQQSRDMTARRDGDGRYRVDELFCHADTWVMALEALIGGDHMVLMDLRSFTALNKGCVVEIGAILDKVPLERAVFVVDETTDDAFLKSAFRDAWRNLHSASPNRAAARPQARLFQLPAISRRAIAALVAVIARPAPREVQKPAAAAGADWQPLRS
jgi:hypothetical protein